MSTEDRQATYHAVRSFVAGYSCRATVRASGGSTGDREGRESDGATGEVGGYVVTHHSALGGVRQPGQGHGAGNVGGRRPRAAAVRGRHVADIQFAGGGGTSRHRVVVESHYEVAGRRPVN